MDAVVVEGLDHRQGGLRLVIAALRLPAGAVVGVCGPKGAGKSTLLRLLAGLERPSAGQVRVLGMDPAREVIPVRQRITWMSDSMTLFPVTLRQHAVIHARFHPRWDMRWFEELAQRFGLDADAPLQPMARAEATRARLVLALGHRPEVILLDEPGNGLDLPGRREALAVLEELRAAMRPTVIVAAPFVGDVPRFSDRVLLLQGGMVQADGTPAEVMAGQASLNEVVDGGGA
jgi:ABC-2 type transport system ATP-binding protein